MVKQSLVALSLACFLLVSVFLLPFHLVSAEEQHGGDILFSDTKKFPPVLFSHKNHREIGNQCTDCHDTIFQKKKGSTDAGNAMTMKVMKKGKFCGTCHNGEKAFTVRRFCKKCHIKAK